MDILTFIRDQAWQFAGFVAAIVVPLILYLKQRSVKALTYEIFPQVALLGIDKRIINRVKVSFDDIPVSSLYLFRFRLANSGNKAIVPDDYIQPVTLSIRSDGRILWALIESTTYPRNLGASISLDEQTKKIIFQPVLLNSGDSVVVQVLLDSPVQKCRFEGRIVDVKEIKEKRTEITSGWKAWRGFIIYMALLLGVPTILACMEYLGLLSKRNANLAVSVLYAILLAGLFIPRIVRGRRSKAAES